MPSLLDVAASGVVAVSMVDGWEEVDREKCFRKCGGWSKISNVGHVFGHVISLFAVAGLCLPGPPPPLGPSTSLVSTKVFKVGNDTNGHQMLFPVRLHHPSLFIYSELNMAN